MVEIAMAAMIPTRQRARRADRPVFARAGSRARLSAFFLLAMLAMVFGLALSGCAPVEEGDYVAGGSSEDGGYQHISPQAAAQIIDWGDATVVDVRNELAYEYEHIPGSINFEYDENFQKNAPDMLPNKYETVLLYCDYGGVSKMAAQDLAEAGYTDVVEFNGLEVWEGVTESGPDPRKSTGAEEKPIPWDKWATALLLGVVFGYVVKRSRFCMTGLIRDTYLERRGYNIVLILMIISIVGLLYFAMGRAGLVRIPLYLPPFSLFSIALGSLMFGFGAVMMNGCLVSTLVKAGDGRIIGWLSLAVFMVCGYFASAGPGNELTGAARSIAIVDDNLIGRLSNVPTLLFAGIAIVCIVLMAAHVMRRKPAFKMPASYTGIRHVLFEARWAPELMAVAVGLVLAAAFPLSELAGRHYGFAVATPVLSWSYSLLNPAVVVGGCNPFDLRIGWASFLVLGIVVGSFVSTLAAGEFSIVKPSRKTLLRSVIGSALMGFGAVLGQGCLISNGLVGTAQFSGKSWYALVFLAIGILAASFVFLRPRKASR